MDANRRSDDLAAFEADVIYQEVGALADASTLRSRLPAGSAAYQAALEIEEHLAEHLWQLATAHHAAGSDPPGPGPEVD